MKKMQRAWSISLIAAGLLSLALTACMAAGTSLPDLAVRLLGLAEMGAIFALSFTTVWKIRKK